ncbi:VOC family protein [Nocardia sp. CNY236]|uniref:VOC family protein n=1 Tax=Nocardia sp. CNY236 TaxID=1169152 RepID=UPI000415B369|nr:VOC family protein [Nocardia sp. CNY236]
MPTHDGNWSQGTPCWVGGDVDDPARAQTFYGELFGWKFTESPPESGGYLMAMRAGRAVAGIGPKPKDTPSAWTTYLAVESADAIAGKLTAAGGSLMLEPRDALDAGRMAVAADPTGAVFGVWEARAHPGAGIYNEHGTYCWAELHTRDYKRTQEFYADVFGWHYTEIGDGHNFIYSTFSPTHDGDGVGGIFDSTAVPGDNRSHWLAWFQVDDTDAVLATARDLGATLRSGPDDSPFGRMGVVQGPQGEVFGVIDTATKVSSPAGA